MLTLRVGGLRCGTVAGMSDDAKVLYAVVDQRQLRGVWTGNCERYWVMLSDVADSLSAEPVAIADTLEEARASAEHLNKRPRPEDKPRVILPCPDCG